MKFDDRIVEQIRNSINIVDLIGGYLPLKKQGQNHSALCPFHAEKTPSFLVSESKQIFKCFGCGSGGDIFKFIMLMENRTFPESVKFLAERSGIAVRQSEASQNPRTQRTQRLRQAMELAGKLYRRFLERSGAARDYLQNRQINAETVERFQVGYAPGGGQLVTELRREGFTNQELMACGLVKEGRGGRPYEYLRQRVIFPIRDLQGRIVAFGGRVMGDGVPKYLNSPDSDLYKKGANLFALDLSRPEIRRRGFAILVEGYFDCVMPHQFGFRNVIASLGTSLTTDQAKLLRHYTRRVVINYDPDTAGANATVRSADIFVREGFSVSIAQVPGGRDPDSFLREHGAQAYGEVLRSSVPLLSFLLSWLVGRHKDPYSPAGKREIVEQVVPHLAAIANRIERAEAVSRTASLLRLDENLILAEMRYVRKPRSRQLLAAQSPRPAAVTRAEKTLVLAALDPDHGHRVFSEVEPDWFENLESGKIFKALFELNGQQRGLTVTAASERLDADDMDLLENLALADETLSDEVVLECIRALRRKHFENLSRQVQQQILEEEKNASSTENLQELLAMKAQIRKKIESDFV
ncbi:MAG: DNA primase [Acidobacteriota bacterium]|nr:DNA primase [Acidobacteriota bacterium]